MVQSTFCLQTVLAALSGMLLVGCGLPVGYGDAGGSDAAGSDSSDVPFNPSGGTGSGSDGTSGDTLLPTCSPVQELSCGSHAVGDTSDFNSGATDELDSYPIAVGNYDSREVAYSFRASSEGIVSFQLVDPDPTSVDHDIFLLAGDIGCNADAAIERGHNSLSFMAQQGETYYLLVDGFNGDEGAYEVAVECGADSGPSDLSPDPAVYGDCLFGWTSSDLESAPHLQIAPTGQYQEASGVPWLVSQQLVQGIQEDGWASVDSIEDVFEYVDADGVYASVVLDSIHGDRFTWLRFYAGDTEVGYLFRENTLEQVALVSDGDINRCSVSGVGSPPDDGSSSGGDSGGDSGGSGGDSGSSGGDSGSSGGSSPGSPPAGLTAGQVDWIDMDISSWPVTSNLSSVSLSGSQICLEYDKKDHWPVTHVGPANVEVVANPWVIAEDNGQWYGRTFEWMRPGQTCKNRTSVAGDHTGAWPFAPGESFAPTPGVTYYFMVSAPARFGTVMTVAERSNLVPLVWN